MGTKQPYLKSKNSWWLRFYIVVNLAAFLSIVISKQLSMDSVDHFWHRLTLKDGFIALSFPLVTIILNGVIGDMGKARLVFWRWQNPLPGCRAFTHIMLRDPRIDVQRLCQIITPLPTEPKEQNAKWYQLYKKHGDKQPVKEAHQAYLLTRDLAALSVLFLIALLPGSLIADVEWKMRAIYGNALLAQYIIIAISARNYGCRFVADVLTEESQSRR